MVYTLKHIALKQEKTSALELKTFCSWSLNTGNVCTQGEVRSSCWEARKINKKKKKKSLFLLLRCVFTELLCSRLIKATPSSQSLCGQHAVGARPPRALPPGAQWAAHVCAGAAGTQGLAGSISPPQTSAGLGACGRAGLGATRPFTALAQRCLKPIGKTKPPAPFPSAQPPSSQVAVGSWSGTRCSVTPEQFLQPVADCLWEHPAKSSASGSRQQWAACPARRLRVAMLKAANTLLN